MGIRATVDVSGWSRFATKERHPLWWGVLTLVLIEVTVVATFLVSYFFLGISQGPRADVAQLGRAWPPADVAELPRLYPSLELALLLLCAGSMYYAGVVMRRGQRGRLVASFVICTVAGLAVLWVRSLQLEALGFRWDAHAYGSIVWVLTGFHFLHVASAVVGTVAIGVLAAMGYFGETRQLAIDVDTLYWYFVSFAWVPIYLVIYVFPLLV